MDFRRSSISPVMDMDENAVDCCGSFGNISAVSPFTARARSEDGHLSGRGRLSPAIAAALQDEDNAAFKSLRKDLTCESPSNFQNSFNFSNIRASHSINYEGDEDSMDFECRPLSPFEIKDEKKCNFEELFIKMQSEEQPLSTDDENSRISLDSGYTSDQNSNCNAPSNLSFTDVSTSIWQHVNFLSSSPTKEAFSENESSPADVSMDQDQDTRIIRQALGTAEDQNNLIGDFSRKCSLTTVQGKHSDLASISPATLSRLLLCGEESNVTVVDCRYPYEYAGGHISGAKNLFTKELLMQELLDGIEPLCRGSNEPTNCIVFHCEFSSERGPKMMRFLREQDRALNEEVYPALHYPEVYLLEGGYKEFWNFWNHSNTSLCQPNTYRLMLDEDYREQLTYYRGLTKKCSLKQDAKKFKNKRKKPQKPSKDRSKRPMRISPF